MGRRQPRIGYRCSRQFPNGGRLVVRPRCKKDAWAGKRTCSDVMTGCNGSVRAEGHRHHERGLGRPAEELGCEIERS